MKNEKEVTKLVSDFFQYLDVGDWEALLLKIFDEYVFLDMPSMGVEVGKYRATVVCNSLKEDTLSNQIERRHEFVGEFVVDFLSDNEANVFTYTTAFYTRKSLKPKETIKYEGLYNFGFMRKEDSWKLNSFKYSLQNSSK